MDDLILDLEYLEKTYPGKIPVEALKGISLQVPKGSIFGLIGPNGAGKSTFIKSLLTILKPTVCRGTLLGQEIGHRPTLRRVGYLPEHVRFPDYMTGRQIIEYGAGLCSIAKKSISARLGELLEKVSMTKHADQRFCYYSKGMKQRIGMAQALIHEPEVLFLDEPTDGIDPEGRRDFRDIICSLRDEGRTIFINSHLLPEVEQMADRVAILYQGDILLTGLVTELKGGDTGYEIGILSPLPPAVAEWVAAEKFALHHNKIVVLVNHVSALQPVIDHLRAAGVVIASLHDRRLSLEEIYLAAIEKQREQARNQSPKQGGSQ